MEFSESIIGKTIGNYEIQRELGRGGMGYVYKAHEQSLQRVVALKVLPPHLASSPQFVKRFEREARSAARLSHPNIVTVFAVGSEGDYHFIAMEYVKGETVDQIVRERGKMDPREAVDVIQQVADALAEAHRNDVIHRDIKPQNIMIDQSGRVKVMDFGLAKVMSGGSELTSAGTYLGTPTYMSPEQCQGKDLDSRTDIYSLGIMFYQMITGTLPFTADTPLAVMRKIIDEPMPALTRTVTGVPSDIEYIIEKMAAKNPAARYSTAEDVSADLKAWLRGDSTSVSSEAAATMPTPKGARVAALRAEATVVSGAKALSDPEGVLAAPAASSNDVTSAWATPPEGAAIAPPVRSGGGMTALLVATATFLVLVGVFGGAVYFLYGRSTEAPAGRVGEGTVVSPAPAPPAPITEAEAEPPLASPGETEPAVEEMVAAPEDTTPVDGIDTLPVTEVEVAEAAEAAEGARAMVAERADEVDGEILEAADDAFENGRAYRQLGNYTEALAAYNTAAERYGALYESLPVVTAEPAPEPEPESEPEETMAVRGGEPKTVPPAEEMARETPPPAPKPASEEAVQKPAPASEETKAAATTPAPRPAPAPAPTTAAAPPAPNSEPANPSMTAEPPKAEEAPAPAPAEPVVETAPPVVEPQPSSPAEEETKPSAPARKRPSPPRHLRP